MSDIRPLPSQRRIAYNHPADNASPVETTVNAAQMIALRNRAPFEPFEIRLSDGSRIRVEHPYHIATREDSPTCIIYDDDNQMRIVAYRNITEVTTTAAAP
jgi:hypothetical protein